MDRTNIAVILGAVLLVAVIALPRVYPPARQGPQCSGLASPLGGNNRSILAQSGSDQQNLDLSLRLDSTSLQPNDPLKVTLIFANKDIGPVILYLNTDQMVLRGRDQTVPGISFEITRVTGGDPLGGLFAQVTQPTTFDRKQLHLLGSRARCSENFEMASGQLNSLGMVPGQEYRIRAFYQNSQRGVAVHPPDATATPAYFDQGVWAGEISSQEVRFEILLPGQLPAGE